MIDLRHIPKTHHSLAMVLDAALRQSAEGKGIERHSKNGEAFEDQVICEIGRRVGDGATIGQAIKKAQEAQRLPYPRNIAEIHGAINYLAATAILMEEAGEKAVEKANRSPMIDTILDMLWDKLISPEVAVQKIIEIRGDKVE
jgi:hypothetical protein